MKPRHTLLLLLAPLVASATPAPVFQENFDRLPAGAMVTKANTALSLVRRTGQAEHGGSVNAKSPSSFAGGSIVIESSGYGSSPNYVGIGVNKLPTSPVYTLSFDLRSAAWTRNTAVYVLLGQADNDSEIFHPSGRITVAGYAVPRMAEASLVALRLGAGGKNARIESVRAGEGARFTPLGRPTPLLVNDRKHHLRIVANGSPEAIAVGRDQLPPRKAFVYLDGKRVATVDTAGADAANAVRIFAQGLSADRSQVSVEIDNLTLHAAAVAP